MARKRNFSTSLAQTTQTVQEVQAAQEAQEAQHHLYKCQACCACIYFTVEDKGTVGDFGLDRETGHATTEPVECRVGFCDYFKGRMYNPKFNNLQPRYCWDTVHSTDKKKWGERCFFSSTTKPKLCQSNTKFKVCPFKGSPKERAEDCKRDGKIATKDC